MPKIEIDGVSVDAEVGATIIEVADDLAIPIPRFCYHKKLSVAANCRMCLVHVDKAPKALPACATPIAEGMKVWTKSKEAVAAQRAVMEFLLINHPLDCPVCDQGGECELQDVSMEYGQDASRYTETKRAVLDHSLGSLIATEMTRCIHCTRCVRFGTEISGEPELGANYRGEFMEIGTFINSHMHSEVSGNVIDLCPVGALTSKPYRFKARPWELKETPGISPHDCIGSNLYLHTRNQTLMRVVPNDAESLNEIWLSDRDRFSYQGLEHDRLEFPILRREADWSVVSWAEALKYAVAGLQLIINNHGADKIGVLASPSATNEEYYLLQKLMRAYGCNNIDHRLRQLDFKDQELAADFPNLGIKFAEIEQLDTVLLIGCNIAKEQPLASLRLRKMQKHGGRICSINAIDYEYNFDVDAKITAPASELLQELGAVAKELMELTSYNAQPELKAQLANINVSDAAKAIASILINGKRNQIILGQIATMHPSASTIFALGELIAQMVGGKCGHFSDGANAGGAWLMGCVPHRLPANVTADKIGLNALQMLERPLNCYILFGIEPEFDTLLGAKALQTLREADFVIVFSAYKSPALLEIADIILPIAMFAERAGTMLNINGTLQNLTAVVSPRGEARPAWKILRVLGNFSGFSGFDFEALDGVTAELQTYLKGNSPLPRAKKSTSPINVSSSPELTRLAPMALYAIDSLVRRAPALQATRDAHNHEVIEVNANTALSLGVSHDDLVAVTANADATTTTNLTLKINDLIANHTAVIYQANKHTLNLGLPFAKLEVIKC